MKTLLLLLTLSLSTLTAPLAPAPGPTSLAPAPTSPVSFLAKLNEPAPSQLLISEDRRYVVVFDAGRASGDAFAICLYVQGKRVKTLSLEDFLNKDELAQIPQCRCPKSHRSWLGLYSARLVGKDLVLSHEAGAEIRISLETGAVRR